MWNKIVCSALYVVWASCCHAAVQSSLVPNYGDVRLKGPFGDLMDRMIRNHICMTDVDYLTACFTERNETRGKWQTEFWGKYMHAAMPFCLYADNDELLRRIDLGSVRVMASQDSDGYIGNYPANLRFGRGWDVWGVKYTMLGLLHYAEGKRHLVGSECAEAVRALDACCRLADYLIDQFQRGKLGRPLRLSGEYGGLPSCSVLEPVVWLYRETKEKKYLDFARYVVSELTDYPDGPQLVKLADTPVADRRLGKLPDFRKGYDEVRLKNQLTKAYELMSCYYGLLMYYEVTGEAQYLEATEKTARHIIDEEINLAGGCSAGEYFFGGRHRQNVVASRLQETCVTITWMRLCEKLLAVTGDPIWAEELERTFYNAYLAAMKCDCTAFAAYTPLNGERGPSYHNCWMYTNCCNANGPRGYLSVLRSLALSTEDEVRINLYFSGIAQVALGSTGKKAAFRTYTRYPVVSGVKMRYVSEESTTFTLALRIPETWSNAVVRVNSKDPVSGERGSYLRIRRTWHPGDFLDIDFDMSVKMHVENDYCAFTRGPLLLARTTRFNDGALDAPIDLDGVTEQTLSSFARIKSNECGARAAFAAFLPVGGHTEDAENGDAPIVVRFCDYASAADKWTPADTCRTWFPVLKHGRTF